MGRASVTKTIPAPADAVWTMVSEWGGTHKWIPGVGPVRVEGEGVGSIRSAELEPDSGFSGTVRERLESFDSAARRYSYSILEGPLPLEDYLAEMVVTPAGEAASTVTWTSTWKAVGADEAEIAKALEALYDVSLDNVTKALG